MRRIPTFALALVLHGASCDSTPSIGPDAAVSPSDLGALPDPELVATVPADGAKDVPVNTTIQLRFNREMDVAEVQVSLQPAVALGDPVWNESKTEITLTMAVLLAAGTEYTAQVSGKDPGGRPLRGKTSFRFSTAGQAPTVLYTSPGDGATQVSPSASLSIAFSEPMDRSSVESTLVSSPSLACGWSWSADGSVATCAPAPPLQASTHYSVTLGTGARDLGGTSLTAPLILGFDTAAAVETVAPTVILTDPKQGATGVPRNVRIKVTFSEPMDTASVKSAFSIVTPATANAGVLTWNSAGTELTFDPQSYFAYGEAVSFTVSTAARDLAGNSLGSALVRSFTVVRQKTVSLKAATSPDGTLNKCSTAVGTGEQLVVGECLETQPGGPMNPGPHYWTRGSRAFVTVDLSPILGDKPTGISSAYFYAYQSKVDYLPYSALGGKLVVDHVNFGQTLEGADYDTSVLPACSTGIMPVCQTGPTLSADPQLGWKSVSVTLMIRDDFANRLLRGNRSQLRLRFPADPNNYGDTKADTVRIPSASAPSNQPYLKVTYEYP